MTAHRSVLVFFLTLLLLTPALIAQESTVKGSLGGTVFDPSGAVVPKAKITLIGPIGSRTTTSDSEGRFIFDLLIPGFYSVKAEQTGFKASEIKPIEVFTNRISSIRIGLEPGGSTEVVEVTGASAGVEESSTRLETSLNDTFYSQLPVSRNVTGLFYAAAGVNEGGGTGAANPSIAGGSGLENQYIADGVSITDGSFGGIGVFSRNYGALATGINLSFVKEVEVKTGGYEPQYGKTTGGIVQIVTKSGGDQFHGGLSAFIGPQQFEVRHLNPDNFGRLNQRGAAIHQGEWDIAGELGGYVPGLRNRLFFFGSFNPAWNRLYDQFGDLHGVSGFPLLGRGLIPQISYDYAAKLTFKLSDQHVLESSVFGDPTRETSSAPNGAGVYALAALNKTGFSKISNGTRNFVVRYNGTLSPTWLVSSSLSWGHNYLNETPNSPNIFQITDNTGACSTNPPPGDPAYCTSGLLGALGTPLPGIFNRQGLGYYENTFGDNYALSFDTQKVVNRLGQHTLGIGYRFEWSDYGGNRQATGGGFNVPNGLADASGLPHGLVDYANSFELDTASSWGLDGLLGVYANVPGNGPTEVTLLQNRGFFSTPNFNTYGRYHSAYVGDSWAIGRHLIVNAGYRWEQQMVQGSKYNNALKNNQPTQVHYTFTDNWSPRFGLSIDPVGNRKTKIYGNYARTSYALPLDVAIRSLSNEEDAEFAFFQPPFNDPSGQDCLSVPGACTLAVNPDGTITPALDDQHVLTIGGQEQPFFYTSYQSGEAIHHGTKMQYLEEYVGGIEHEFLHGIVGSVRYQQRRLRRIIEDQSGVSPEAALLGIAQQFEIGNPSSSSDLFTNTNEAVYPVGGLPSNCPLLPGVTPPTPAGGTIFNPYNPSQGLADVCVTNPATAGATVPDGIPDGFVTPVRTYKAVEVEINKSFSRGWQLRTNYRWSTLAGNYEGAFRNDNGQSDPGISSLFDFTPGKLNMLGDQFAIGFLNTDRRHIFNNFVSYTFSTGFLRNLTLGTGVRIETGNPINDLRAHPVYQNGGEVPIGGRGARGRTPTAGYGDVHTDYMVKLGERHSLHLGADLFNIANQKTQLRVDQFQDASLGTPNFDFLKPVGSGNIGVPPAYQRPFNARLFVRWVF
jgi:hypothetical protein